MATDLNVWVAPRQHGKTYLMTLLIQSCAYSPHLKNPEILLVLPTLIKAYDLYENEFSKVFKYSKGYSWPSPDTKQIAIQRPDGGTARIYLRGSVKTPKSAKGLSPDLIVMDEAGMCHPETLVESLIPSVNKSAGKIFVTGTAEGGWFHSYFISTQKAVKQGNTSKSVFSFKYGDKWSVEAIGQEKLERIKKLYDFSDPEQQRLFRKEQMCDWFASKSENIFASSISLLYESERVCRVPLIENSKIGLSIDNGIGCTGIWFWQYYYGIPRFVRYQEWRGKSIIDICRDINKYCESNRTAIGCIVFPHTVAKREESTLKPVRTIWLECLDLMDDHNLFIFDVPKVAEKAEKYQPVFHLLKHSIFDEKQCDDGLRKIQLYNPTATKLERNQWSHAMDSLSEFAMCFENNKINADLFKGMYYNSALDTKYEKELAYRKKMWGQDNKKALKVPSVFGGYY